MTQPTDRKSLAEEIRANDAHAANAELQRELEHAKQYVAMFHDALHEVDKAFQVDAMREPPILPDFCRLGESKFEAVPKLAQAYKDQAAALTQAQQERDEARAERDTARSERNIMLRWLRVVDDFDKLLGLPTDASPEYTLRMWTEKWAAAAQECERLRGVVRAAVRLLDLPCGYEGRLAAMLMRCESDEPTRDQLEIQQWFDDKRTLLAETAALIAGKAARQSNRTHPVTW